MQTCALLLHWVIVELKFKRHDTEISIQINPEKMPQSEITVRTQEKSMRFLRCRRRRLSTVQQETGGWWWPSGWIATLTKIGQRTAVLQVNCAINRQSIISFFTTFLDDGPLDS